MLRSVALPGSGHFMTLRERNVVAPSPAKIHLSGHSGEKRFMGQDENWDKTGGMVHIREVEGLDERRV